jgi:hypothetical protein
MYIISVKEMPETILLSVPRMKLGNGVTEETFDEGYGDKVDVYVDCP